MNPLMMDPLHVHAFSNLGLVGPGTHQQFGSQPAPGFNPSHLNHGYREEPRPLPVLQKTDPHSDAHVSGDDFERSCVIYVAGLNSNIEEGTFFDTFRQFGNILSCVRRAVDFEMKPSGQQYAFIRYSTPEEARFAISVGEIEVQGRKLIIKPRDKKGSRAQRQNSHGSSEHRPSFGVRSGEHILKMIGNKNHQGRRGGDFKSDGKDDLGPPLLLSKSLTASNLPDDMGPKQLYQLFSEVGPVEGCYVFPMCDHAGRRYGHVVMNSFYYAQKAVELLHGIHVQGYVLDVAYKSPLAEDTEPVQMQPAAPAGLPVQPQLAHMFMTSPPPAPPPQVQGQLFVQHQSQPPMGWVQGMGNVSSRPFVGMPQQYGVQTPQMLPVFNTQGPVYNQPQMDYPRYNSPPLLSTPSPPQPVRWSGTPPEQKPYFNSRQYRRVGPPPGLAGNGNRHPEFTGEFSSEDKSRSVSNCTDNICAENSATNSSPPPRSEEKDMQRVEESPREICQEESAPDYTRASSSLSFEILTPPVIPDTQKPTDPCNLFIKNLDDSVISTSEELQKHFEAYGQVASAHLATYNESNISRGYGFVAFGRSEDAAKAKEQVHNTLIGRKRVFVSYAERKEDRAKRLKSIFQGTKLEDGDEKEKGLKGDYTQEAKDQENSKEGKRPEISAPTKNLTADALQPLIHELSKVEIGKRVNTPADIQEQVTTADKQEENKVNTSLVDQRAQTAHPVGSTRGWRGTQLPGIEEVEEEKIVSPPPAGKLTASTTKHVEHSSTEASGGQQPQSKASGPPDNKEAEGSKAGTGNKRNARRAPATQKVPSGQVQTAVPNFRNANSVVPRVTSRIPVQTKGGASTTTTNSTTASSQIPTSPPTCSRAPVDAASTTQNPTKKRGYKGNNRNARGNTDKTAATAEGGASSSSPLAQKNSGTEQQKSEKEAAYVGGIGGSVIAGDG